MGAPGMPKTGRCESAMCEVWTDELEESKLRSVSAPFIHYGCGSEAEGRKKKGEGIEERGGRKEGRKTKMKEKKRKPLC